MIGPGADAKVLVCTQFVDGRKGLDSLCRLIEQGLGLDPYGGVVFIFRSKRKDRLKIVWWDGSGLWLMLKRAESRDGFCWPQRGDGSYRLTAAQMSALVSGLDWRRVHAPRKTIKPKILTASVP
jgi:transposase